MSRAEARFIVTSSPPSRMVPAVGSSSPAIMRSVVVLPQPEGPSRQRNSPSSTVKLAALTAWKSAKDLSSDSTLICAIALLPDLRDNGEHHGAEQRGHEGPGIQRQEKRLHQHDDAGGDDRRRDRFQRTAPQNPLREAATRHRSMCIEADWGTAPKVMPRSKCLRNSTVNTTIGTRNSVVPAATAGQSCPPSPMMIGMKGGAVCALPEVRSTAKAYSFQAKIRQKMALASIPVVACGSTTFTNA